MNIIDTYIYGSGNSLDVDKLYIVDRLPDTIAECKAFCEQHKQNPLENVNIATIQDGTVSGCFKGTPDELNNAVLATFDLHGQSSLLHIERPVKRDIYLKCIRAVRTILSHLSRSDYRPIVKGALNGSWEARLDALKTIDENNKNIDFNNLNNNMSGRDVMKTIAFQMGQTMALITGFELYTKDDVAKHFPSLGSYMRRMTDDPTMLYANMKKFIIMLDAIKYESNGNVVTFWDIHNQDCRYTYNIQTETRITI